MRTAHGQRTSASCAVFPCAFIRRGRGVHAHPCIPLLIPLPECTFATALAAITIPPAPARAGGVQKTATKAQFNRIDKCPNLWPKSEPNAVLRHPNQNYITMRRYFLNATCPGSLSDLSNSSLVLVYYRMKAQMPMNVIVSCRIRHDLP